MLVSGASGVTVNGITVKKNELLTVLLKNKSQHYDECNIAKKGYKLILIKKLVSLLQRAKRGRIHTNEVVMELHTLQEPESHIKDYDRVIKMIQMCTKDELIVTEQEFQKYVMDDWEWKERFTTTNSAYVVGR